MRLPAAFAAVLFVFAAGCDDQSSTRAVRAAGPQSPRAVTLSADEIARLGIETAPAPAASYTPQVHGYGVVVNTTPLAQIDAAITTARAAQQQSQAALKRARTLFGKKHAIHAVSNEALDAAERQAAADDAAVELAERSEASAFGQRAPWRGKNRDDALLAKLASGRDALVEATFSLGGGLEKIPSAISVAHLKTQIGQAGQSDWKATIIWNAPADPTIPGKSFYALINGSDLEQGEHVLVFAPTGKALTGVRIPSTSVVLNEDKAWCYAVVKSNTFVRLPIDLETPLVGGYFVAHGISPGQPVVVAGTGLLLAREIGVAAAGYN